MKNLFPILVFIAMAVWFVYLLLIEPMISNAWFV